MGHLVLFIFSCDKKESPTTVILCTKGKFLYPWCTPDPDLSVIQVFDTAIGGDFTTLVKTYKNTVLAHTILNNGIGLRKIANTSDSIFYFTYEKNRYPEYGVCEVGNPPKINIRITSIISAACPTTKTQ